MDIAVDPLQQVEDLNQVLFVFSVLTLVMAIFAYLFYRYLRRQASLKESLRQPQERDVGPGSVLHSASPLGLSGKADHASGSDE